MSVRETMEKMERDMARFVLHEEVFVHIANIWMEKLVGPFELTEREINTGNFRVDGKWYRPDGTHVDIPTRRLVPATDEVRGEAARLASLEVCCYLWARVDLDTLTYDELWGINKLLDQALGRSAAKAKKKDWT